MSKVKLALIGIGKIARDQHIPHIAESPDFELVAAVTRHTAPEGVPGYPTLAAMKAAHPEVTALSVCTPPFGRLDVVREALTLGLDVMIEKPPAATVSEARASVALAAETDRVFYATWHSREAAAVEPAKSWLADKMIKRVTTHWKEDVRVWHPGQSWIWSPGVGVFDPGVNALSVLTEILPGPVLLDRADLRFPENKDAPIAADLDMRCGCDVPVRVEFDFDQTGEQTWMIEVETDTGTLRLTDGASRLWLDDAPVKTSEDPEYRRLYRRFAQLLAERRSDVDMSPFQLVADAFHIGRRQTVGPFNDF
ncbi:Gfo/Idh/MocA family protein [Oceanicaulis sp.]|uniref:Gfo/Idh/MocA family protein n=1 Tax=Oceanicaulis sp. TaxID=1924941 RepID=UPI003F71597F